MPLGEIDDDVAVAQHLAVMSDPVVDLELDPRRGEDVERGRGDEVLPLHQLLAHRDRVRFGPVRGGIDRRHVAAEARADGAHFRIAEVVVAAVIAAADAVLRRDVGRHRPRLRRRLAGGGVDEVLLAEFVAKRVEIEEARHQRQPVPGAPAVDRTEAGAGGAAEDAVPERRPVRPPAPELAVRQRGVVDGLPGAVEVAERPEVVRRVPGVEAHLVDHPALADARRFP